MNLFTLYCFPRVWVHERSQIYRGCFSTNTVQSANHSQHAPAVSLDNERGICSTLVNKHTPRSSSEVFHKGQKKKEKRKRGMQQWVHLPSAGNTKGLQTTHFLRDKPKLFQPCWCRMKRKINCRPELLSFARFKKEETKQCYFISRPKLVGSIKCKHLPL